MNSCDHFSQKEEEKADDAPEDFSLDQNEGEMDFSLPSKKKKKKKVILTEGDDLPTEEGVNSRENVHFVIVDRKMYCYTVNETARVVTNSFWK